MNLRTKFSAALLILTCLVASSCKKHEAYFMNDAVITGFDYTLCACCGGYYVKIDGQSDTTYLAQQMPDDFREDRYATYPIKVKINWERLTASCGQPNLIRITATAYR